MSKFPLLNTYRSLAIILAVIVVIAGILSALGAASLFRGFDLGIFIITTIPFLGGAFALGVVAELILLLLRIEDHLEHIRHASERPLTQAVAAAENSPTSSRASSSASPPSTSSYRSTTPAASTSRQMPDAITVRIQVKVKSTSFRIKPDAAADVSGSLNFDQSITVYGRNTDATWLTISKIGRLWIDVSDVDVIEGDIDKLPVIPAAE